MENRRHDETHWPAVRILAASGPEVSQQLASDLVYIDALLERKRPFGLVIELLPKSHFHVREREAMRRHLDLHDAELRQYMRGLAFVISSRLQRAVVNVLGHLARPPCPVQTFSTQEAAIAWVHGAVRACDVVHP